MGKAKMGFIQRIGLVGWLCVGCGNLWGCGEQNSYANDVADDSDEVTDSSVDYGYTPLDFYQQCTDIDCDFRMYEGEKRVLGIGTWHPKDTGFSFIGDPVLISVTDDYAAHPDVPVRCYTVSVLGYWEDDVQVSLEVAGEYGIFGMTREETESDVPPVSEFEGEFLFTKPLLNGNWNPFEISIRTLKHRGKLDFSIRTEGTGTAVFYLIEVDGQTECPAAAQVVD